MSRRRLQNVQLLHALLKNWEASRGFPQWVRRRWLKKRRAFDALHKPAPMMPPFCADEVLSAFTSSLKRCKSQQLAQMREISALKATVEGMTLELRAAKQNVKRARFLAFHDELTSLPNRRYFNESLGCALRSDGRTPPHFSILLIDVRDVGSVFNSVGHIEEERVLRVVAARLWTALRAEDLACHLGGGTFACVIHGIFQRKPIQTIAAALHKTISEPIWVEAKEFILTVRLGVACFPIHGTKTDSLLKAADNALRLAKQKRVGTCFPDNDADAQLLRLVQQASMSD